MDSTALRRSGVGLLHVYINDLLCFCSTVAVPQRRDIFEPHGRTVEGAGVNTAKVDANNICGQRLWDVTDVGWSVWRRSRHGVLSSLSGFSGACSVLCEASCLFTAGQAQLFHWVTSRLRHAKIFKRLQTMRRFRNLFISYRLVHFD